MVAKVFPSMQFKSSNVWAFPPHVMQEQELLHGTENIFEEKQGLRGEVWCESVLQDSQVVTSTVTKGILQMQKALAESTPEGLSTLALEVLRDMNAPDLHPGIGYTRLRKEVNTWKHEAQDAEMDAGLRRSWFSALGTVETPSDRKHTSKQVCRLLQLIQHRGPSAPRLCSGAFGGDCCLGSG